MNLPSTTSVFTKQTDLPVPLLYTQRKLTFPSPLVFTGSIDGMRAVHSREVPRRILD